jgi:hypothetical protein
MMDYERQPATYENLENITGAGFSEVITIF